LVTRVFKQIMCWNIVMVVCRKIHLADAFYDQYKGRVVHYL